METPTSISEINLLIENQIQENIHLDYKSSAAIDRKKVDEISKDVSAFANSDGGIIIYGVIEKEYYPEAIDLGVDHSKYNREWIEQIINSNIFPRIEGVEINQIPHDEFHSLYVLDIPKSFRGPHQAKDKKYYKRFNFQSVPMEDYEIRDINNRQIMAMPLINIDIDFLQGSMICLTVENIGDFPAYEVQFEFPNGINWPKVTGLPPLLKNGTRVIPIKRKYSFYYYSFIEIINDESIPSEVDIDITYLHPMSNTRLKESFHFDFMDFFKTAVRNSEFEEFNITFEKNVRNLISELKSINQAIGEIGNISAPTGLNLSYPTLRNLHNLLSGIGNIEKYNPKWISSKGYQEILGVDLNLALKLRQFFTYDHAEKKLMEIEGMTEEIKELFLQHFKFEE